MMAYPDTPTITKAWTRVGCATEKHEGYCWWIQNFEVKKK